MAKKKFNSSLQDIGFAAAGVVAARMVNKVDFIAQNPTVGGAIKTGLGIFMATQKNKAISSMGLGMAAAGATELITNVLPAGTLPGIGLLNPSGSTSVHAVAGPGVIID